MSGAIFEGVTYSQVWEDPALATAALGIGPDDDVLAVTSAGDDLLAFAAARPRRLVGVDVNPAQTDLFELKRAALAELSPEELLELAGVTPSTRRAALYRRVAPALPAAARARWDASDTALAAGWLGIGRFERYLGLFARRVLPAVHSRAHVDALLAQHDAAAQRAFYDEVWDTRRWRLLFRVFFGRAVQERLGRSRHIFRYAGDVDIGATYLARVRHGLTEVPTDDNWYLEYAVTGRCSGLHGLPPYLDPAENAGLRDAVRDIHVVTADIGAHLTAQPAASLSCFYLSDVFEYLAPDACESVWREIVRTARPGARFCYYTNLVERPVPASVAGRVRVDTELGRELLAASRVFFYGGFVVGRVTP